MPCPSPNFSAPRSPSTFRQRPSRHKIVQSRRVRSVEPESTTMISPLPSRTRGITLSSVRWRLRSSFCVIKTTDRVTRGRIHRSSRRLKVETFRPCRLNARRAGPNQITLALITRRLWLRGGTWRYVRTGCGIGNIRHVSYLSSFSIGHDDSGVVEQQAGGPIQLHPRLLISCLSGNQIGFGGGQASLVLQYSRRVGDANRKFLLLGVQCLAGKINRSLGSLYAGRFCRSANCAFRTSMRT